MISCNYLNDFWWLFVIKSPVWVALGLIGGMPDWRCKDRGQEWAHSLVKRVIQEKSKGERRGLNPVLRAPHVCKKVNWSAMQISWVRREAAIQNPKMGNSIVDVCIIGVAQRARGFDAVVEVESWLLRSLPLLYSRLQCTKISNFLFHLYKQQIQKCMFTHNSLKSLKRTGSWSIALDQGPAIPGESSPYLQGSNSSKIHWNDFLQCHTTGNDCLQCRPSQMLALRLGR